MRGALVASAVVALLTASAPAGAEPAVTVHGTAGASDLILDGTGSSATRIVKIADVEVASTQVAGCVLRITSGHLAKADGSTPIAFQVALVDDGAPPPASTAFTTPAGSTYMFDTGTAGTFIKDLYIKYRPASLQDPGAYSALVDLFAVDN